MSQHIGGLSSSSSDGGSEPLPPPAEATPSPPRLPGLGLATTCATLCTGFAVLTLYALSLLTSFSRRELEEACHGGMVHDALVAELVVAFSCMMALVASVTIRVTRQCRRRSALVSLIAISVPVWSVNEVHRECPDQAASVDITRFLVVTRVLGVMEIWLLLGFALYSLRASTKIKAAAVATVNS